MNETKWLLIKEKSRKEHMARLIKGWMMQNDYIELQASRGTISKDSEKYIAYLNEYNAKLQELKVLEQDIAVLEQEIEEVENERITNV